MPFNNLSDPEMVTKSAAVVEALTPERYAYLLSLLPTPQSYSETHERFEGSYAAALKGGSEKVKACEADRSALNQDLAVLLGLAKAVAVKDPTVPETLGLGRLTEKAATPPVTPLTGPHDFRVVYNPEGRLVASVTRVIGAKGYQVWACEGDPNLEGNWKLAASSSNCRGIVITGLNRGKPNWLKIRAVRGNTTGPWSNCVSLTPN